MAKTGTKLGSRKEAAIQALLTTRSIEEAARFANIPARTLYRWLKDPDFDAAYRKAKRTAVGQSTARLHHLTSAAVTTLGKIMLDPAMPPATRVRAADSILDHSAEAMEDEEIEARISAVEKALGDDKDKNK